ncbi:MAG: hypothetical protein M0017_05785, partial [Desulfobacteraceae bacterium]|nr:hypothetical protein [Desulfobacteraceae bacterium]
YYRYYCVFCHGENGVGRSPVGDSYMPAPPSLRQAGIGQLPDDQLLLAMLTGVGHDPVLERVVPPRHRWPLLLYVRSLSARKGNVPGR